jgi:thiol-disulfide isomerase/thioredoxin
MKFFATVRCCLLLAGALAAFAQSKPEPAPSPEDAEQRELNRALAEAGNSPVDFVRVLEQHLNKYPQAKDRDKLERALVSAAIEAKDDPRTIVWGERVLVKTPKDVQILQKVAAALAAKEDHDSAEKAYGYAHRLELELTDERKQDPPEGYSTFRWQYLVDRRLADSLRLQARAQGVLGKPDEAVTLAHRGFDLNPTASGAREWGRWLAESGKTLEALEHYADAFTMEDPDSNEADRAQDRKKMAELYHKLHKSEKGLGDIVLQAYDRTYALTSARMARVRENDPNVQAKAVLDFTLPAVKGEALKMQTLKGKTVVLDFWATWCQPCRIQRPMYEEVERSFSSNPNVVFLSVNADEDQSKVAPFVASQNWTQPVYFDAGLGALLKVGSIPTTIVLNREGQIVSRMTGFIPDRFIDMLTSRIKESLQ